MCSRSKRSCSTEELRNDFPQTGRSEVGSCPNFALATQATDLSCLYYLTCFYLLEVHVLLDEGVNGFNRQPSNGPGRPVTRESARGAFAPPPPPQALKVRILILNIQVKECSRLN